MTRSELGELSQRELILMILERMDGFTTAIASNTASISKNAENIDRLEKIASSNAGFFKAINWVVGIPGVLALIITGKGHV